MTRPGLILLFLLLLSALSGTGSIHAQKNSYEVADSIMAEVVRYVSTHQSYIKRFKGETYIKGKSTIKNKNFLLKQFPGAFPFESPANGAFFETINEINYEAPNKTTIRPIVINGNSYKPIKRQYEITTLIGLNIYGCEEFDDKFILPSSAKGLKLYEYKLVDTIVGSSKEWLKIRFIPKRKTLKMLSGHIYIEKGTPFIRMFEASGWLDIASFSLKTRFGENGHEKYLPSSSTVNISYNILNNLAEYEYQCIFNYTHIIMGHIRTNKNKNLDRSEYFSISADSVAYIPDSVFWQERRRVLLEDDEMEIIGYKKIPDSIGTSIPDSANWLNYKNITNSLVKNYTYNNSSVRLKYSGLVNPAMISYSTSHKVRIRQQLRFRKMYGDGKYIGLQPEVGYSFGKKQWTFSLLNTWLYSPSRLGSTSLQFRTGTSGFSSRFIDLVNSSIDSTQFNFRDLNITTYRDYHVIFENRYELTNGLLLYAGATYNYRIPDNKARLDDINNESDKEILKDNYTDFAPFVRLEWTPLQFYRYVGREKRYLQSPSPTFSLEYAKGIPNVLNSNSRFDRIEFEVHQSIPFTRLGSISFKTGVGAFFNQKSEYFIKYRYFEPRDYPESWNDGIGGVFNLLDDYWYYASDYYAQLHLMYESPFILLHLFKRISRFVLTERIYFSQLFTPARVSYSEFGYGMGNYIFNVGAFASFHKQRFNEVGIRVTLELDKYW